MGALCGGFAGEDGEAILKRVPLKRRIRKSSFPGGSFAGKGAGHRYALSAFSLSVQVEAFSLKSFRECAEIQKSSSENVGEIKKVRLKM